MSLNLPLQRSEGSARPTASRLALAMLWASFAAAAAPALAQRDSAQASISGAYYGPRIGVTYLSEGVLRETDRRGWDLAPVILQFGWQWEQRFVISSDAPMLASAFVFLVGGAEQGKLLPSLSWLVAIRGTGGAEFGVGPVVSLTGANLALVAGGTSRKGEVNIPIDVVVVLGRPGVRVSLLTGFNMSRRRLRED